MNERYGRYGCLIVLALLTMLLLVIFITCRLSPPL